MSDMFSKQRRHEIMSSIRSKNTKPELFLRKALFAQGFRYRINYTKLPGKPDIYLPRYKTTIFVHGCFWHGHDGCKDGHLPKTNVAFWSKKINDNINRDKRVIELLEQNGFHIIAVWECQLTPGKFNITLNNIIAILLGLNEV